jgi:hypothetical protein
MDELGDRRGLMPLGDILKQAVPTATRQQLDLLTPLKPFSRVQHRLLESKPETDDDLCFQHTIFCQTGLPYRDPGKDVRRWERRQGSASVLITAGEAQNPQTHEWVWVGLPWGAKATPDSIPPKCRSAPTQLTRNPN